MKAWTNFPMQEFGDTLFGEGPIRIVEILSCGKKSGVCSVRLYGIEIDIPCKYLYNISSEGELLPTKLEI